MTKTDFANKLTSFNIKITSNKSEHLEVQRKLNSLRTNDYNIFLGSIYFKSNDGSQDMFVNQPTLDTLELKRETNGVYNFKLKPLYVASLHNIKLSGY